jgi:hypothetical protein
MKKTESFIRVDYWPHEHARRAYAKGFFIEAIQVLHGCVERQLRELIFLSASGQGSHEDYDSAIDSMFELPLHVVVKVLFIQKALSKTLRDRLMSFNKARNAIVHKIYFDSSRAGWQGLPKAQYDKAFHDGLALIEVLEEKIHEFV